MIPVRMSSGCLACCIKPKSIASLDDRLKGNLRGQRRIPSISRDSWTTSACDMDNSTMQSQGSLSSINASIQVLDTPAGVSSSNQPSEFVNHGNYYLLLCLLLWNQTRQRWVNNKKQSKQGQQSRDPKISWNATYESLLGTNKPFGQPVPLAEMVDFLVDIWEQEGMYD
ncbi:Heat-inducible transcription repressor HrcA [Bienertia sinuspersici]